MLIRTNLSSSRLTIKENYKYNQNLSLKSSSDPLPAVVANLSVQAIITNTPLESSDISKPTLPRVNSQSMLLDFARLKHEKQFKVIKKQGESINKLNFQLSLNKGTSGNEKVNNNNSIINHRFSLQVNNNKESTMNNRHSVLIEKYGTCDKNTIGSGATSTIRLSHKLSNSGTNNNLFAIKRYIPKKYNQTIKEYLKSITSEFCIGVSLNHINIIKVIDLVYDEELGSWCQVMNYCPNGDLFNLIKQNKQLTINNINIIFKQLIKGVNYLHKTGVIHRDIKPENILFDSNNTLKISDFGSAEVIMQPWNNNIIYPCAGATGSLPYISPEGFNLEDFDGRKADIWSCGIIYYFMITNHLPWKYANDKPRHIDSINTFLPKDLVYCNYKVNHKLPHNLPKDDQYFKLKFLTSLLCINPDQRPFASRILESDLFVNISKA